MDFLTSNNVDFIFYYNFFFQYFTGVPETDDQQRMRFQVELEFVQCLANPNYLNCKFITYFY